MARPTRYVAVVDPDGKLALPDEVAEEISLRPGDQVEVVIGRFSDSSRGYWQQVAEFEFPDDFQHELHRLLQRNTEGLLDAEESVRLDTLIQQVEWQTAQRARARLELRSFGEQ